MQSSPMHHPLCLYLTRRARFQVYKTTPRAIFGSLCATKLTLHTIESKLWVIHRLIAGHGEEITWVFLLAPHCLRCSNGGADGGKDVRVTEPQVQGCMLG